MYYRDQHVDECAEDWKKLANLDDTKQEFVFPPLSIKVKIFIFKERFSLSSAKRFCQSSFRSQF
jgi:hypothetical protein